LIFFSRDSVDFDRPFRWLIDLVTALLGDAELLSAVFLGHFADFLVPLSRSFVRRTCYRFRHSASLATQGSRSLRWVRLTPAGALFNNDSRFAETRMVGLSVSGPIAEVRFLGKLQINRSDEASNGTFPPLEKVMVGSWIGLFLRGTHSSIGNGPITV
jgi:hypothetical protein